MEAVIKKSDAEYQHWKARRIDYGRLLSPWRSLEPVTTQVLKSGYVG
jgi:hypothetical protein